MNYLITLSVAMLVIFSSCKKKEEAVNTCQNGFLDPGESSPDCGGNCPPCSSSAPASLYVEINGSETTMTSKQLYYDQGNWSLNMQNDSLNIQLNFGSNGSIGTYPISTFGTYALKNGTDYPLQEMGTHSISEHDVNQRKMNGYFQIRFLRQLPNNPLLYDTLELLSGQFSDMVY